MPDFNSMTDQITYRLVLVSPDSALILAELVGKDLRLPRLTVPRWTRHARQIQNTLKVQWNVPVVILDFLNNCPGSSLCIAELLSPQVPEGQLGVPVDLLNVSELSEQERQIIRDICSGDPGIRGPFSRAGWISEAKAWVQKSIQQKVPFEGDFEQHNAGGSFALVRFGLQDGTAYWLKAVGAPNVREFPITMALARICPDYLPRVIATRNDWNAWVMQDAGEPANSDHNPDFLEAAVIAMAKLQKRTSGRIQELLTTGATDQRMSVLAEHVGDLMNYLDHAMQLQISTKAPRLGTARLREVGEMLTDACAVMETLRIPDTIIHNDLNRGNVLIQKTGCVFIDWCEAGLGCPFMALQHLISLIPDTSLCGGAFIGRLRSRYRRCWAKAVKDSSIDRALDLAKPLAIASRLYGRGEWLGSQICDDSGVQAYARALARRIDRAVQSPEFLEALCR